MTWAPKGIWGFYLCGFGVQQFYVTILQAVPPGTGG